MRYSTKAKKLLKTGFWMAGEGNFTLHPEDIALLMELLEKNDFKSIRRLYLRLYNIRMYED